MNKMRISTEIEIIKRDQTKILDLKNTITELKFLLGGSTADLSRQKKKIEKPNTR